MKQAKLVIAAILVGVGVALTYFIFEAAVSKSIDSVWYELFNSDTNRVFVIPLVVALGFIFFGVNNLLNEKSNKPKPENGVEFPDATLSNLAKVLFVGFLSLFAGASLGPEAVLIPACVVVGGLTAKLLYGSDTKMSKLLSVAGFVALFVAFFNTMLGALLGYFLLKKMTAAKANMAVLIVILISSISTFVSLMLLPHESYFEVPPHNWNISVAIIFASLLLIFLGYFSNHLLSKITRIIDQVYKNKNQHNWWRHALIATIGLTLIYLIGGPLIEFTGNKSILPMLEDAPSLGLFGLIWIAFTKLLAIAWSKNMGYKGGLIFPNIFVAATLVAIIQIYVDGVSMPLGIILVLVGMLFADRKTKVLI